MQKKRKYIQFHLRVFWVVTAAFVLMTASFVFFQYLREKQFKIELLNSKLVDYSYDIYHSLKKGYDIDSIAKKSPYRTSLIDLWGSVIYDSEVEKVNTIENHYNRPEIKNAIEKGVGYDVRRKSETTGEIYFYSAKRYGNKIIRLAMPYNNNLTQSLKADLHFLPIALFLLTVLGIIFYSVMKHFGESVKKLNEFAMQAENDDMIEYPVHFPNNELGDISRHIIQIYNRLMKAKNDLLKEKQLVVSEKEEKDTIKRQLTQNIAHELKTPVSSIQGYLETIINNKDLPLDILTDFIAKSYTQTTRLSALLRDITNLTRIDEAPELIQKEYVDIENIIKEVISDVSLQLKERKIEVVNRTKNQKFPCYGNISLLYSVFRNLFDNTISYAGNNIFIEIELCKDDVQKYYFSYSDTGSGIEEQHLTRIFERFYRVDKGRSRKIGGTGLGLAVAKHAILFHNGEITAQARQGGGVTFLFSIGKD
jgi:signal transduction histidine kinase